MKQLNRSKVEKMEEIKARITAEMTKITEENMQLKTTVREFQEEGRKSPSVQKASAATAEVSVGTNGLALR